MNDLVPFFCHFCEFLAYDLIVLKEHKGTHDSDKKYNGDIKTESKVSQCYSCSKTYTKKHHLKVHIESVHEGIRHFCEQCGTSHKTKMGLRSHILFVHEKQQKPEQKTYQCTECHKKFSKIFTNCKDHIRTCKKCGYITNIQDRLKKHQSSKNCDPNKSKKSIMCGKCRNMFTTEKSMRKHELSHTNGKPHKCHDCGVGFTESFAIKKHKKKFCKGMNNDTSYKV